MKKITAIVVLSAIFLMPVKAQLLESCKKVNQYSTFYSSLSNAAEKKSLHLLINTDKDYDYYMHKRKKNKTIGWALLGGGFGLTGIGVLMAVTNNTGGTQGKIAAISFVAGAAAGIASIPFMIIANVNKNKAKAFLSNQKTGYGMPLKNNYVTGVTISIPISIGKRR